MPNGVFKGPTWASITNELNQRTGKNFIFKQVQQKHNRLRLKQRKWSQLLRHTRLGWDELTQTITCDDEVWQNVIAVCLLLFIIYITYCNYLFMQFASKLVIYELVPFFFRYISYCPYLFMQVSSKLVIYEPVRLVC